MPRELSLEGWTKVVGRQDKSMWGFPNREPEASSGVQPEVGWHSERGSPGSSDFRGAGDGLGGREMPTHMLPLPSSPVWQHRPVATGKCWTFSGPATNHLLDGKHLLRSALESL